MPRDNQRRSRRGSTGCLKSWMCLILCAPSIVRSSEDLSEDTTGGTTNASVMKIDQNDFCGKTWTDAYENCPLACPSGNDSDCAELGPDYKCQKYSLCYENILSGAVVPNNRIQPTPEPTDEPTDTPIIYPICPVDYNSGAGYIFGSLIAHTIPGVGSNTDDKSVYSCQGNGCNIGPPGNDNPYNWKLVGSCPPSSSSSATEAPPSTITQPTQPLPEKWWLGFTGERMACLYGNDYPSIYMTDETSRAQFIFETEEECCTARPDACVSLENLPTTGVPVPSTATSQTPTKAPSGEPTYLVDTYMPTEMDDNRGALFIPGQGFLLCIMTIFMVSLF
mmetsp:Transcript_4089/g.9186  ORF Transcript_4089/g.9186 Transcript_4089/m.9186 type:complete len:335 (-) Transcript_4089:260-1264(-)